MKFIRSNRPVSLLQLSSPLFIAFLLVNAGSVAMAQEQPKAVKVGKKKRPQQHPPSNLKQWK